MQGPPNSMTAPTSSTASLHSRLLVAAEVVLACLGLMIHNVVEFPHLSLMRPEYAVPILTWLVLYFGWVMLSGHRLPTELLFGWGVLSLAGAVITVLPLPILPFHPEQSLRHYGVHVIYAATQLPILRLMRRRRQSTIDHQGE
jgi:hypothetical protein